MIAPLAECAAHCSTWHAYTGLLGDLAHWAFEITVEVATAPLAFIVGKTWARREHRLIDAEHGVQHPPRGART